MIARAGGAPAPAKAGASDRDGGDDDAALPELAIGEREEDVVELLRTLQRAALAHSEAARALFGALAREGRLFAQTAEGRRWQERLASSALVERAALVWQGATLWLTEEAADTAAPPSALVDAVVAAAASPRRDALLDRLFRELDAGE